MHKSSLSIILHRFIGFLFLIIILAIANILIPFVSPGVYSNVVGFFNTNLFLLIILFFIGLIDDLFWNFRFPFNILAPISSSFLGVFITNLLYKIWLFIDSYAGTGVNIPINLVYVLVFFSILVFSYIYLFVKIGDENYSDVVIEINEKSRKKKKGNSLDWEDVGDEFRLAFYNIAKSINKALTGKESKKK